MSQAAARRRANQKQWAVPGSPHDRLVRWIKIGLPVAAGILIAILMLAPLDQNGDVSFILDKNKVASAQERMRVERARYVGSDDDGQRFVLSAKRAVQPTSDVPIVDIEGIRAELELAKGPIFLTANRGQYDIDRRLLDVRGPLKVTGPDQYELWTSDVVADLATRKLRSEGPVRGRMTLGSYAAGGMEVDLDQRILVLDRGVRLKIVQGKVR